MTFKKVTYIFTSLSRRYEKEERHDMVLSGNCIEFAHDEIEALETYVRVGVKVGTDGTTVYTDPFKGWRNERGGLYVSPDGSLNNAFDLENIVLGSIGKSGEAGNGEFIYYQSWVKESQVETATTDLRNAIITDIRTYLGNYQLMLFNAIWDDGKPVKLT